MKRSAIALGIAAMFLSVTAANAGPCTTGATQQLSKTNDAGSGPTPGAAPAQTAQQPTTNGNSVTSANPEQSGTALMNEAVGDKATSSQDVRKQIQGQPTAAQQAQKQQSDC
jgi:hypothetical protein